MMNKVEGAKLNEINKHMNEDFFNTMKNEQEKLIKRLIESKRIDELAAECCTLNQECSECKLSQSNKCYIRNMAAIMIKKYDQKQKEETN